MESLQGKTAIVTGASRGIGRAIAIRLAHDGAAVAVHYASNDTAAGSVIDTIRDAGGRAFGVRAPLGGPEEDLDAMFDAIDAGLTEHAGIARLDILVNNAGIAPRVRVADAERPALEQLFSVNVFAPLFVTQKALLRMAEGGRIINISSGAARLAMPDITTYAMTKGALDTFSHQLAEELGPRGITVNSIQPGVVDTEMNASWLRSDPAAAQAIVAMQAIKRIGQPEDIAAIVAFLASAEASFLTGVNIDATGGARL